MLLLTGHTGGGGYCWQEDDEQVGAQNTFKNGLLLMSAVSQLKYSHSLGHQIASS